MNYDKLETSEETLSEIKRELNIIKFLLYAVLILIASWMSSALHKDLPIIVVFLGLLFPICYSFYSAAVRKANRAKHEKSEFSRLSGRSTIPSK